MYDRRVDGRVLSFGHSGILYRWSFVLYDRQTESLWVQASGRAERGPLAGSRLRLVPSTVTTWERWKAAYPDTVVLPGDRAGSLYGDYDGFSAARSRIGLVVHVRFKGVLYPYPELENEPVVNDSFNGASYVVVFSRRDGTAAAWNRTVAGRTLTFEPAPEGNKNNHFLIRDRQTSTMWDWLTGVALRGPLEGRRLDKMQSNPMLMARFAGFYPQGRIFRGAVRRKTERETPPGDIEP